MLLRCAVPSRQECRQDIPHTSRRKREKWNAPNDGKRSPSFPQSVTVAVSSECDRTGIHARRFFDAEALGKLGSVMFTPVAYLRCFKFLHSDSERTGQNSYFFTAM